VTLSAIFYSSLGIIARHTYMTGLEMELVTLMRFLATVILLGVVWLFDRKRALMTLAPAVLFQGLFFAAAAVFFFFAVKHLSAGLATVVMFAHPALVALLAMIIYREKITPKQVTGLVLALLGLFFISGLLIDGSVKLSSIGLFLAVLCAVAYGLYVLLGQHTVKKDGVWTIMFTMALMGLVMSAVMFSSSIPLLVTLTPYQVLLGFGMAVLGTILPVVLFLKGVRLVGASTGSIISMSEIPLSLAMAFLILGEVVTPLQILGTVLIGVATVLTMTGTKKK